MRRSKKSSIRLYNVSNTINFILDETKSPYLRAVRLYEAQIAITFGQKLNKRQRSKKALHEQWLAVPSDMLAAACLCSSVRLLQQIQASRNIGKDQLSGLIEDQNARDVLSHIMLTPEGLKKIATAYRPQILNAKLRNRRRRQRRYAPLYDVSLRWQLEDGSEVTGGWSTALQLFRPKAGTDEHLTIREYYPGLRGRSSAYKFKDKNDYLAAFVWLRYYGGGIFQPNQVNRVSFAKQLLSDVIDTSKLIRFFGQYEFIRDCLSKRGYELLPLVLTHPVPPVEVTISPLSEELLDALSSTVTAS